jgi:hypothetical protein
MSDSKRPNGAKNYCGTLNNPTSDEAKVLKAAIKEHADYAVMQLEEGKQGTPHLQLYVHLKSKQRLTFMKATFSNRAHWEIARGSPEQNRAYCTKEEGRLAGPWEHGDMPTTGGQANKQRYADARALMVAQGDPMDLPPDLHVRHYATWSSIRADARPLPPQLSELTNEWHVGPTGAGKSSYTYNKYQSAYIKSLDKWWDGYTNQDTVCIHEVDDSSPYRLGQIKVMADYYAFPAQSKGKGAILIRPKRIVVTSNMTIEQCCTDKKSGEIDFKQFCDPMQRRFTVYDWDVPYSPDTILPCQPYDANVYSNTDHARQWRYDKKMVCPWDPKERKEGKTRIELLAEACAKYTAAAAEPALASVSEEGYLTPPATPRRPATPAAPARREFKTKERKHKAVADFYDPWSSDDESESSGSDSTEIIDLTQGFELSSDDEEEDFEVEEPDLDHLTPLHGEPPRKRRMTTRSKAIAELENAFSK